MSRDLKRVGVKVEEFSHAVDYGHKLFVAGQRYTHPQPRLLLVWSYLNLSGLPVNLDCPPVTFGLDHLNPGNCSQLEKAYESVPI
jgi:hypothetical protein